MRLLKHLNEADQKELILLVGLPASGKSTYISKLKKDKKYVVISNDVFVEKKAKQWKIKYNEAFKRLSREDTLGNTQKEYNKALSKNVNIIVDNTNINKKERKVFLDKAPDNYKKIAIIFNVDVKEIGKRLKGRENKTGKHIPPDVIEKMSIKYEKPSSQEGFDEIRVVK